MIIEMTMVNNADIVYNPQTRDNRVWFPSARMIGRLNSIYVAVILIVL